MTTQQLHGPANETFTRVLAQRVLERLLERQKQALVVFTGSDIGADTALKELSRLRAEGFSFRVLLTRSAAAIWDPGRIRAALDPEDLWTETPKDSPEALAYRHDTILVPAMTMRTAAHVAACTADTPAAAVILDGLLRGKNVVINTDGCCPDNAERARRGFCMAQPLRQALRDRLITLHSFGAVLATSESLCEKTLQAIRPVFSAGHPTADRDGERVWRGGRVLGARHLQNQPSHSTLLVPAGTLITQSAADEARRRDISLQKMREGR